MKTVLKMIVAVGLAVLTTTAGAHEHEREHEQMTQHEAKGYACAMEE